MIKSKFDLGPWRAKEDLILNSKGILVAEIIQGGRSQEKFEANTRLIAAAPEMLDALDRLRKYLVVRVLPLMPDDEVSNLNTLIDHAHEAIAKARGT